MTPTDRLLLERREELTSAERFVINRTFGEIYSHVPDAARDTRALSLEAAMIRFFLESRDVL